MCHTELALKKKCNSLDWRRRSPSRFTCSTTLSWSFSHWCQAGNRIPWWLRGCNMEDLWWFHILIFLWKIVLPVLVTLKSFSQIKTKTIISRDFRPLQRRWCCHNCRCFLWQKTSIILLTYRRTGWGEESVPICVLFSPLTTKEGWMSWV